MITRLFVAEGMGYGMAYGVRRGCFLHRGGGRGVGGDRVEINESGLPVAKLTHDLDYI